MAELFGVFGFLIMDFHRRRDDFVLQFRRYDDAGFLTEDDIAPAQKPAETLSFLPGRDHTAKWVSPRHPDIRQGTCIYHIVHITVLFVRWSGYLRWNSTAGFATNAS